MQNHIFLPIPKLEDSPQPGNKEERLKVIIANLEKHHQDVRYVETKPRALACEALITTTRSRILGEARRKLDTLRQDGASSTEMDIDEVSAPDHKQLIANLNAPYIEGSGDPSVPPGSVLQPDPNVKQAPVPPEVLLAQEVTQQLEAYDKHAKQTREYYVKALERQRTPLRGEPEPVQRSNVENRDPRRRPTG